MGVGVQGFKAVTALLHIPSLASPDVDSLHQDPMPYFSNYLNGPVHALFTSDALETRNNANDQGMESMTSPHININTGERRVSLGFRERGAQGGTKACRPSNSNTTAFTLTPIVGVERDFLHFYTST